MTPPPPVAELLAPPSVQPDLSENLADLTPGGHSGVVELVTGDRDLKVHLSELGFYPGAEVRVVRRAPLGCPLEVEVNGGRFSLRCEIARHVHLGQG